MYDQQIKLIKYKKIVDKHGDIVPSEPEERTVFVEVKSAGQSEFYQAKAVGLKPEIKFELADYLEYQNEKHIKYQGYGEPEEQMYSVIRTYRNGTRLEITCKRGFD